MRTGLEQEGGRMCWNNECGCSVYDWVVKGLHGLEREIPKVG